MSTPCHSSNEQQLEEMVKSIRSLKILQQISGSFALQKFENKSIRQKTTLQSATLKLTGLRLHMLL